MCMVTRPAEEPVDQVAPLLVSSSRQLAMDGLMSRSMSPFSSAMVWVVVSLMSLTTTFLIAGVPAQYSSKASSVMLSPLTAETSLYAPVPMGAA